MTWKQSYSEQVIIFNKDRVLFKNLMETYISTRSILLDLENRLVSTQLVIKVPKELLAKFEELNRPNFHFISF